MSKSSRTVALALFTILGAGAASAGVVTVTVDPNNSKQIVVEAQNATVDEILARLNEARPFAIERLGEISSGSMTRRYSGDFRHVLERVLENESHLVVTSEIGRQVQRVVIYGTHTNLKPAAAQPAQAVQPEPAAADLAGPPKIDPVVQAALDRAKRDAEAAKARGEAPPHEVLDPGPFRRSAMNGYGRSRRGL